MSPPYLFRIDEIGEHQNAPVAPTPDGRWIPSTNPGTNIKTGGGASGILWYCDGQRIYQSNQNLPSGSIPFKTYSMYYSAGCGILAREGDATTSMPQDWHNWHLLRFTNDNTDYSSYLTIAGDHATLHVQRDDQQWPQLLLPDIYHTSRRTWDGRYGGLTGELPIFLGLIALSTSQEHVINAISQSFAQGAWRLHQYRQPRDHQRGIVVYVYTTPTQWGGGSTRTDLEEYESGRLGKYFY